MASISLRMASLFLNNSQSSLVGRLLKRSLLKAEEGESFSPKRSFFEEDGESFDCPRAVNECLMVPIYHVFIVIREGTVALALALAVLEDKPSEEGNDTPWQRGGPIVFEQGFK